MRIELILNIVIEELLDKRASIGIIDDLCAASKLICIDKIGFDERKMVKYSDVDIEEYWMKPLSLEFDDESYDDYSILFFSRKNRLRIKGMIKFPAKRSDRSVVPGFMNVKFSAAEKDVNSVNWESMFRCCIERLSPSFAMLYPFASNRDAVNQKPNSAVRYGVWAWQLASRRLPDLGWLTHWGAKYEALLSPELRQSSYYINGVLRTSTSVREFLDRSQSDFESVKDQISIEFDN